MTLTAKSRLRVYGEIRQYGCALFLLLAGCVSFPVRSFAQQNRPEEYRVKAVYLYNFGKFVQWPAVEEKPPTFTICLFGADPFGKILDQVFAGETIEGRNLTSKHIASAREAGSCQILFISAGEAGKIKEVLAELDKRPVLTVSDADRFLSIGGMIQFVTKENKIRFEVNRSSAEKAGLTLSSQLLRVAASVTGGKQP